MKKTPLIVLFVMCFPFSLFFYLLIQSLYFIQEDDKGETLAQLILLHYLSHLLIQAIQYIILFFIALWRNNSHTIHLSIQSVQFMILVYFQRHAASPQSNFRIRLSPLKEISYPLALILHSLLQPQATTNLLQVPVILPILVNFYKWNHIACGLL